MIRKNSVKYAVKSSRTKNFTQLETVNINFAMIVVMHILKQNQIVLVKLDALKQSVIEN